MGQEYQTTPVESAEMPPGILYIVNNEAAERFSFYGMRTILMVFMTKYLMSHEGGLDVMTDEQARVVFHDFVAWAYFFPIVGALIADTILGKYRTIIFLSIVYCLGHLALALDETRLGLGIGLTLIAIGSGGIKPCVSAHVGDQFGSKNQHLLNKVFNWFYFSINLGAAASTMLTPVLLKEYGPSVAFGVPGVLMLLATIVFWSGRHKFIHVPAGGIGFLKECFSGEGLIAAFNLSIIYAFVAIFWSLFDQTGSAWILQAERMDRHWMGVEWLSSQIQAANPILIMIFIPIFTWGVYPFANRFFEFTPLRKIAVGFFLAVVAFAIPA
ncbi:MAG: MFS transporter, partial [Planctomycetales bacterium]